MVKWLKGLAPEDIAGIVFVAFLIVILTVLAVRADVVGSLKDDTEMSFISTSGNSSVTTFELKNHAEIVLSVWDLSSDMGAFLSRTDDGATAESYDADIKATSYLWWIFDKYNGFGWERDRFAGVQNRWMYNAGIKANAMTLLSHKIACYLGFLYLYEERIGQTPKQAPSAHLRGNYEFFDLGRFRAEQDATARFNLDDRQDIEVETATSITTNLTKKLFLKNSYILRWKNEPVTGFKTADHRFVVGLLVRWR